MLIILIVIIGLSLLILGHEAGHFFVAKAFGLKIDEFGFGFPPEMFGIPMGKLPPRIWSFQKGEVLYTINWIPFGGFVRPAGEADGLQKSSAVSNEEKRRILKFQPAWKRSLVILAGVFVNFILGWLFFSIVLMVGAPAAVIITGIQPGSPAAQADVMPGDVIKNFTDINAFINFVDNNKGKPINIPILRGGKELDITMTPRFQTLPGQGALGVELEQGGTQAENPILAIRDGFESTVAISWLTIQGVWNIFKQAFTQASIPAGIVGPIGMVGVARETAQIGWIYLIQLFGEISISLMVVNSLPIPALDGGQFFFIILEKIKGSPISEKWIGYLNGAAFLLIIIFMIFVSIRDIQTYIL